MRATPDTCDMCAGLGQECQHNPGYITMQCWQGTHSASCTLGPGYKCQCECHLGAYPLPPSKPRSKIGRCMERKDGFYSPMCSLFVDHEGPHESYLNHEYYEPNCLQDSWPRAVTDAEVQDAINDITSSLRRAT